MKCGGVYFLLGLGLFTVFLSWVSVDFLRRWAEGHLILDYPNERSSHSGPIPRVGGLAIACITLAGGMLFGPTHSGWSFGELFGYLFGAILIVGVGWMDDVRTLPSLVRFAAHIASAALVIAGIGYLEVVDFPMRLDLGWVGLPITALWIVGLTNAFNFMDGIDGLAGGTGAVAGFGWVVLGWLGGYSFISILGVLLAASSLGFLVHNWPPARIFMGDSGSTFLGFTLAVIPVAVCQDEPRIAGAGVLLIWPFVFDTCFTVLRRLRAREDVFAAHRSHLYQRLIIAGYSHCFVTGLYIFLAFIGACLSIAWFLETDGSAIVIAVSLPVMCGGLWLVVARQERE